MPQKQLKNVSTAHWKSAGDEARCLLLGAMQVWDWGLIHSGRMKCYSGRIICGLLFTTSGLDQATHPLCGFTSRTEAALCLCRRRLHIHIHAQRKLVKDTTHETLMSGVCACRRGLRRQYSVWKRSHTRVFLLIIRFDFTFLTHNDHRGPPIKYQSNDTCINVVTLPIIISSFLDEDLLALPDKLCWISTFALFDWWSVLVLSKGLASQIQESQQARMVFNTIFELLCFPLKLTMVVFSEWVLQVFTGWILDYSLACFAEKWLQ